MDPGSSFPPSLPVHGCSICTFALSSDFSTEPGVLGIETAPGQCLDISFKYRNLSQHISNPRLSNHLSSVKMDSRRSEMKSEHPDKDKKGGPSPPTGEPMVEIVTKSLMYGSLHNLHKDIVQQGREAYTTWLLWVWDLMGTGMQLDGGKARNLVPLTQDSGMNQVFVREPDSLFLWEWLLMSVRERFVHRERMQEHQHRTCWKTLEEGIQQLREVAALEVLFGRDGQHDNDPDKVRCTGQMLWSLANLGPCQCTTFIAMINADTNQETVGSAANKFRNCESMINGPMQAHVSAVIKELKEEFKEEMRKMKEESKLQRSLPPSTHTMLERVHPAAEDIKQLNTLPGLSENPSAVGLLRVEEQQVPIATSTVHNRQYWTNGGSVIPIHRMIRELESQGVFSKTHSPFNNPTWPVRKSGREWRLTHELESKAAKWYATIDIAKVFSSIPLAAECRLQFAFTWRGVQCTWNRLAQGWKSSPTTCHGLIQAALEKGEPPEHLQYIDGIIVWGNTAMEVFEKGQWIIQILLEASFAIKKSKVKGPT
ncbi:Gag-Pol polyprotein [Lonchura striata]|uniref:ribonuclease H n=1 Tax=Lonchura striata TaxID=40157 RepID=A0A218ULB8_9PASE|nr:Gag-Pol polyprotein [Lonchura striata domestica]